MLKKGLGKGLSALIPDAPASNDSQALEIEVERIAPNPFQPRRSFDEAAIAELATSIRENGVIQPLLVRRQNGGYELIAGERRLRAAVRAGLDKVPVVVREASDHEALQFALIENVQREDLNPMEEATAYQRLQEEFGWSQEEVASRVGMSRPAVANSIRLLLLPREVQEDVASGRLAAGQARALLGLQREALILSAARDAIAKGFSTRETERLVQKLKAGPRRAGGTSSVDADLRSLIETLQRSLGTKVRIIQRGKSARGRIEIDYYSSIDLDRIVQAMTSHP